MCAAIAYAILLRALIRLQGADGALRMAVGRDWKGTLSPVLYLVGLVLAWLGLPAVALGLYTIVAMVWLVPDRRIERYVAARARQGDSGTATE